MEYYFRRYGDLELHRRMVSDRWRTDAFAAAIREVVQNGDLVLDIGTGTGILAMLAARAGAKMVWAIDQSEIAQTAVNLVKANDLSSQVKVLRGPASELAIQEPVDLIISEWIGNFGFVEDMLPDVLEVRNRLLKEGGRMMPSHVDVMLAPIDDPILFSLEGPGFWRGFIQDIDFTSLEELELQQGRATQIRIEPVSLLAEGQSLVSMDLADDKVEARWASGEIEVEIERDGILNGFAGWFVAQLSEGVLLDTGPSQPETHWSQTYFAFPPRLVRKGTTIAIQYSMQPHPEERRHVELTLKVGRKKQVYVIE